MAPWPRTLLACLLVSACALLPASPPSADEPGPSPAAIGQATVPFAISHDPPAQADLHHYEVTLYDAADQPVTATGLTNPLTIMAPATSGSLTNVPPGTGYYLTVEAFDATGASITQGGPVTSTNTFNVAGSTVTYRSGTAVTIALHLVDATPDAGTSTVTLTNATTQLAGADRYGAALLNPVTRQATVRPAGTTSTIRLTGIQTGNPKVYAPTHDLWVYVANSTAGTAVPAMMTDAYPPNESGEIAPTLTHNLGSIKLDTIPDTNHPMITGIFLDEVHNLFYATSDGIWRRSYHGDDHALVVPFTTPPTGWWVDHNGQAFVSHGSGIDAHFSHDYGTADRLVTAPHVGRIAVDERRNLYWHDTANGTILKSIRDGLEFGPPITVATDVGTVAVLKVNAAGDVFYTSGPDHDHLTDIYKAPLSPDDNTYGAPVKVVEAGGLSSLAVDRVGNVYFTDRSPYVRMVGAGNPSDLIYTVAGNGVGTTGGTDLSGVPTGTDGIVGPDNVAISVKGQLFFTSQAGPAAHEIRRVK